MVGRVLIDDDDLMGGASPLGSAVRRQAGIGSGPNGRLVLPENWDGSYVEDQWVGAPVVREHRTGSRWSVWRWHDGSDWLPEWYVNLAAPWMPHTARFPLQRGLVRMDPRPCVGRRRAASGMERASVNGCALGESASSGLRGGLCPKGSWCMGSITSRHMQPLVDALEARGAIVHVPFLHRGSLAADTSAVQEQVEHCFEEPIVVSHSHSHSYGGAVAAGVQGAASFLFIAAFVPDIGESCAELGRPDASVTAWVRPHLAGGTYNPADFARDL